jgi:hypothetical protein
MSLPDAVLPLADVQEAAAEAYEIYGELGRGARGLPVYLARERSERGRMVLLELHPAGGGSEEFYLEFAGEVHAPGSVTGRICPSCGVTDPRSGRFCARCRYNFADSAARPARSRQELFEQVRTQTSNTYDILGEVDHAEGRGVVYLARAQGTGALVALRLQYDDRAGDREEYSLDATSSLDSLLASLVQAEAPGSRTAEHRRTIVRQRESASAFGRAAEAPGDGPRPRSWGRERARRRSRRIHWAIGVLGTLFVVGAVILVTARMQDTGRSAPLDLPVPLDTSAIRPIPQESPPAALQPESLPLPPAGESLPPDTSEPQPPATITLRFSGVPAAAVVKVDSEPVDSQMARMPPGTHTVSVAASGYKELVKSVEILSDSTLDLSADLASLKVKFDPCRYPGQQYNVAGECYDEPPRLKRGSTLVRLPPDFVGNPRPSAQWVKVSADGRTVRVEPSRRSAPEFEELSTQQAYSLVWDPATKNDRPVAGWLEVELKPAPR